MADPELDLARGREAVAAHEWTVGRDTLSARDADTALAPADRYLLAQCHWWLGDLARCDRELERVHRDHLEAGDAAGAAVAAMELAVDHFLRGDEPVGSGWIQRAARLAEDLPESPIHGYVILVLEIEARLVGGDVDGVVAAAQRVQAIGHRCGDASLVASGLNGEGRMLIRDGRVAEGLALLDESMVSVLAGEVSPEWAGNLYCNTVAACHELGDLRRMARWTAELERWLARLPAAAVFAGICRVHRAHLLGLTGDWRRAETEAIKVCAEQEDLAVLTAAAAWYELAELRRRRGDLTGAEQAYRAAHQRGHDPQPGLALLHLARGRAGEAASSLHTALVATSARLSRAPLLAAQVEVALATGDTGTARGATDELSAIAAEYGSDGLRATSERARGALLLAEGDAPAALPPLRGACELWRQLHATYEAARTAVLLASAYAELGDTASATMERDAARETFVRLGADPGLAEAQLDRALPAGLSRREVEVLQQVAQGRTNGQIAEALFISHRTVARHLSNIFVKLQVSSRTEAARFAFDHGLVRRPG